MHLEYRIGYKRITIRTIKREVVKLHILIIEETHLTGYCAGHEEFHHFLKVCFLGNNYNPQIQISAESETKRSIFREKDKTKRSKKESAQHSKSRNKSFVMTSVSAL